MLPPAPTAPARSRKIAAAWTAGTALLLLVPIPFALPPPGGLAALPLDKLVHALLFVGLVRSWRRARPQAPRLLATAAAAAYGGAIELLQGALGVRTAEWGDFAADALGAALGAFLPL